jgi:hypothetical protein
MCGIVASLVKTLEKMYSSTGNDGLSSYRVSLTLFASVAVVLIACTLINSVLCIFSFHKGLKDHIAHFRKKQPASDPSGSWTQDAEPRFVLN